jgi:hypothetical protein
MMGAPVDTPAPIHNFGIIKVHLSETTGTFGFGCRKIDWFYLSLPLQGEIRKKYVPHKDELEWEPQYGVFLDLLGQCYFSSYSKYDVLVITSIVTEMRADDALVGMRFNEFCLSNRLLDPSPVGQSPTATSTGCLSFDHKLAQYAQMQKLNSSQLQALRSTLAFTDPKWLNLIRGPPGMQSIYQFPFDLQCSCFVLRYHQAPERPPPFVRC